MRFRKIWNTHRCVVERTLTADGFVGETATATGFSEETKSFDFLLLAGPERDEILTGGSRRGTMISKDSSYHRFLISYQ